jgi:hypothetical protein
MTVGLLIAGAETHKLYNVKCVVQRQVVDASTFGGDDLAEVGRTKTCSFISETKPRLMGIYDLRIKDGEGCKRFQVLEIQPQGSKFQVSGMCLSEEEL